MECALFEVFSVEGDGYLMIVFDVDFMTALCRWQVNPSRSRVEATSFGYNEGIAPLIN